MTQETTPDEKASTATRPAEQALASALRTAFGVVRVVMIVVLVALVFSNTRFLQQNQRAVILRFGKIVGTGAGRVHGPGLVFAWPQPIDEIIIVDAGRIQDLEVDDFMYRESAREGGGETLSEDDPLRPGLDGYTLTGDANVIHTIWRVQYQVDDIVQYALNIEDPEELIRRALGAAVVHTSAEFTVEDALWRRPAELRRRTRQRLQERLDEAASGIAIVSLDTTPEEPLQTTEAFTRARQAVDEADGMRQDAEKDRGALLAKTAGAIGPEPELAQKLAELVEAEEALGDAEEAAPEGGNEAELAALRETVRNRRAEVNELLDGAGGEVTSILSEAKRRAVKVEADAASMEETFKALNREYQANPGVFVREIYQNTIEQVLSRAGMKFILYDRDREVRYVLEPKQKAPEKKEPPVAKRAP